MKTFHDELTLQFDSPTTGNAASGELVTVFNAGLATKPAIFDVFGSPIANPLTTDIKGNYSFQVADGIYDVVGRAGTPDETRSDRVNIFEAEASIIDRLNPATLAIWQNDTSAQAGDVVTTAEYSTGNGGGGTGQVISGTGTANGKDIVAHNTLSLSFKLRLDGNEIDLKQLGLVATDDVKGFVDRALVLLPNGGKVFAKDLALTASDTIIINVANIKLQFINSTVNPVASFPSTNIFSITADSVKLKGVDSDLDSQLLTLIDATAAATKLKIFDTTAANAGGQVINSVAADTMVSGVDATNCAIDTFTNAIGVVRLVGINARSFDINLTDCFGKGISFSDNNFRLKRFNVKNMLNQGSAGGIGVYTGFDVKGGNISKGIIDTAQTHLMKLSGGGERIRVSSVDYINNGTVLAASTNAMLEVSGVKDCTFSKLNFNYTDGAATLDAMARFVFHTAPNFPSVNNILSKSTFRTDNTEVRAINIVGGGAGLESSGNMIDACPLIEGVVTIGGTAGDADNTLQNSKIVCEAFVAITASNSTNTNLLNNDITNTRARAGSDDYVIRSDGSSGLTVQGGNLRGQAIGIRSDDPNINISGVNFRMAKQADSIATVRNIFMVAPAAGIYANNNLREATADVGAGLLNSVNNNVTSAL